MEEKMVIIFRKDLKLSKGKMVVQGGHAVVGCLLNELYQLRKTKEELNDWVVSGQKKIALKAETIHHLKHLASMANAKHISAYLVKDLGYTEVEAGTVTCLGIGPAAADLIDEITGKLSLV
jgi:PTH2 family peptidyl-tRNA hydrolase